MGSQPMNLGGTKASPSLCREPSCQKKKKSSAQTPRVVSERVWVERRKNQMPVKRRRCPPPPPALLAEAWPQSHSPNPFLSDTGTQINPASGHSHLPHLPGRRPPPRLHPAPNSVAALPSDPPSRSPKAAPVDYRGESGQTRARGAAPRPQLPPPPGQGVPTSPGLGEGARKEESALSARLPPLGSSEVATTPAAARCSGAGRARARASLCPRSRAGSEGKVWSRGGGLASASPSPGPPPRGAGASPATHPTRSAPRRTLDPPPRPRAPPWGSPGSPPRQVVTGGDG